MLVGDSRVSAISQSASKSSQPISANINSPALFYSSSSEDNLHRKRRSSKSQKEGTKLFEKMKYIKDIILNLTHI